LALLAAGAKETGVTVLGVFCAIDLVVWAERGRDTSRGPWIVPRVALTITHLLLLGVARVAVNGPHRLYPWTVLENAAAVESAFLTRAFTYAQSHALYAALLIAPRFLVFDSGYSCLPVLTHWGDVRHLGPLSLYLALLLLARHCLASLRRGEGGSVTLGAALLVLPLVTNK
jgi:hypothetical protein